MELFSEEEAILFRQEVALYYLAYLAYGPFPHTSEVGCQRWVNVPLFPLALLMGLHFVDGFVQLL